MGRALRTTQRQVARLQERVEALEQRLAATQDSKSGYTTGETTAQSAEAAQAAPPSDSPELNVYRDMLAKKVPRGAVEHRMRADGISPSRLDGASRRAAPAAAPACSMPPPPPPLPKKRPTAAAPGAAGHGGAASALPFTAADLRTAKLRKVGSPQRHKPRPHAAETASAAGTISAAMLRGVQLRPVPRRARQARDGDFGGPGKGGPTSALSQALLQSMALRPASRASQPAPSPGGLGESPRAVDSPTTPQLRRSRRVTVTNAAAAAGRGSGGGLASRKRLRRVPGMQRSPGGTPRRPSSVAGGVSRRGDMGTTDMLRAALQRKFQVRVPPRAGAFTPLTRFPTSPVALVQNTRSPDGENEGCGKHFGSPSSLDSPPASASPRQPLGVRTQTLTTRPRSVVTCL